MACPDLARVLSRRSRGAQCCAAPRTDRATMAGGGGVVQPIRIMTASLSIIDIAVVVAYLGGVVGMSYVFARRQHTGEDYFLAGRSMRGVPLAISILANQASAVSLVGAPAFVAL